MKIPMKFIIAILSLIISLFFSDLYAQTQPQPQPKEQTQPQIQRKTILDFKDELKLSEKQVKDIEKLLQGYFKRRKNLRIRSGKEKGGLTSCYLRAVR
jgi:hypothetical protein